MRPRIKFGDSLQYTWFESKERVASGTVRCIGSTLFCADQGSRPTLFSENFYVRWLPCPGQPEGSTYMQEFGRKVLGL